MTKKVRLANTVFKKGLQHTFHYVYANFDFIPVGKKPAYLCSKLMDFFRNEKYSGIFSKLLVQDLICKW